LADSRQESNFFHNRKQRSKITRTGWRAIHLAGPEGSLAGFDLLIFILFSGNGGAVFEPVTPPSNGNGLRLT
jgi:hypothetical protein